MPEKGPPLSAVPNIDALLRQVETGEFPEPPAGPSDADKDAHAYLNACALGILVQEAKVRARLMQQVKVINLN